MTTPDNLRTHATLADSGETTNSQQLPRGSNLGRYVIIEPIGSGGMGTVYRAYDPQLNRGVALKILSVKHADQQAAEKAKARLIREAQALAQLSHPNVVAVHDAGTFEDDVFIAMELVEGKTLNEWMKEEKRPIRDVVAVMTSAGRGLSAAHKAGLVHRDFKPGNVIVGDDGRVRVLDFGMARAVEQEELTGDKPEEPNQDVLFQESKDSIDWKTISSDSSQNLLQSPLTHAGGILGTPMYMAPEQHLGLKTDERTDQFGFCVVLYEALYGKRPFAARSREELKSEVIRQQVCVPSADTDVPGWLWEIIRKGLSVKPEERYPTIDSLLEDLDKDPEQERKQKRLARRRKMFAISLIVLTVALPFGVWYGLRYRTFQLCKDAQGEFDGVWDDAGKALMQRAFLDTEKFYALGTWERVERIIDRYLTEWMKMRSDICEARLIRGTQSEEFFDLRMSCLQRNLRELRALLKVFSRADADVLQKAVQACASLTGISVCADEQALRAPYPPPKSKESKVEVAAIRDKLAKVKALTKTGKYQEGLVLAQNLEKKANAVAYRPVQAEVMYLLGDLLRKTGKYKEAEVTLHNAALAAGECGNSELATKAMVLVVWIVGYIQAKYETGLAIARDAEVMLAVAGGDANIQAALFNNKGTVFWTKSEYDKALECFRKTLAIMDNMQGPKNPIVAQMLNNIGVVFGNLGQHDKALISFRKSLEVLEEVLGPAHPDVARTLTNMGRELSEQGNYNKALEYLRQSQTIWEKSLGTEHPLVAWPLSYIGSVFYNQGKPERALSPLERVVSICEKKTCNLEPHGRGLFVFAQVLMATSGDKERAAKLAKQAREIFEKTPKMFKKEIEEVTTWLQKHGSSKLAKKVHTHK